MNVLHPHRYPIHENDKGQIFDGACNTTRCDRGRSVFWNSMTFALYCPACAKGINQFGGFCHRVHEKPDLEEMNTLYEADIGRVR